MLQIQKGKLSKSVSDYEVTETVNGEGSAFYGFSLKSPSGADRFRITGTAFVTSPLVTDDYSNKKISIEDFVLANYLEFVGFKIFKNFDEPKLPLDFEKKIVLKVKDKTIIDETTMKLLNEDNFNVFQAEYEVSIGGYSFTNTHQKTYQGVFITLHSLAKV